MTSVRHTNGDYLRTTTLPTMTGDWIWGFWLKIPAAGWGNAGETVPFGMGNTGGSSEGFILDIGFSVNTTCTALLFRNAAANTDSSNILTGSDANWIFVSLQHASGSSSYTLRTRRENSTTFTTVTLNCGAQITAVGGEIRIGSDQFDEHVIDASSRSFWLQATTMSDATLLTASQNLNTAPTGTNLHWLDLDSPTNAEVNGGTAANWTVTGTLLTDSSEPTEAVPGQSLALLGSGCRQMIFNPNYRM